MNLYTDIHIFIFVLLLNTLLLLRYFKAYGAQLINGTTYSMNVEYNALGLPCVNWESLFRSGNPHICVFKGTLFGN